MDPFMDLAMDSLWTIPHFVNSTLFSYRKKNLWRKEGSDPRTYLDNLSRSPWKGANNSRTKLMPRHFYRLIFLDFLLGHSLCFPFTVECVSWYWVGRSDWKKKPKTKNHTQSWNRTPGTPASLAVEPGKNKTWTQNQYGGKVGGCCCKIKTKCEKGPATETPMRHKNGLKT